MQPTEYDGLGLTRPHGDHDPETTGQALSRQDIEAALVDLPLRLESPIASGFMSETWLVKTTTDFCAIGPGNALVAKLTGKAVEDSSEFFDLLSPAPTPVIFTPLFQRTLPGNRKLSLSAYMPLGSLRDYMRTTTLGSGDIETIVRQITAALERLANLDANRVLVHGDIKPENILVVSQDPLQVCLADLDHSRWVAKGGTSQHDGMLSLRYAAPEALGGIWSSKSDLWSFGILLTELLLGRHPLDGFLDESVRALVSGTWDMKAMQGIPDFDALSENWRAILLGLVERSQEIRWHPQDIELWLTGDRNVIARGLSRGREVIADSPFEINGHSVYTARTLARALVGDWDAGRIAVQSPELGAWLRDSLGNADLASRHQMLSEDLTLSDDDRLIRFAYFAHHELDPFWRDIRLSSPALQQLATQALDGQSDAYLQLVSLRDSGIVESYSSLGIQNPERLIGAWRAGWERYVSAWQRLQEVGAPDARPPDEAALPALVRLWLSEVERQKLASRFEQRSSDVRLLLRRGWYFALGADLTTLPVEHQWILDSLDHSSLVETLTYSRSYRDLTTQEFRQPIPVTTEQLMNSVLFSETTERLTRNLLLRHGSREEISLVGAEPPGRHLHPDGRDCRRAFKSDQLCALNFDQGR